MNVKRKSRFVVPNYGLKTRKRVPDRWRHQRGVDNKKRIMRAGYGELPSIGYKNPESVRHKGPDGNERVLVHDSIELASALQRKDITIVFSARIGTRKRLEFQKSADQKGVKVANRVQ